jgi:DUF4097 and DUF4098 domain-containing protein YvlB
MGRAAFDHEEMVSTMEPVKAKAIEDLALPREGASELSVKTSNGAVQVTAGEGDQLQVHAVKEVRSATQAAAEAFLSLMQIERRRDGDRWVIEAAWPEPRAHHVESPSVSFEIQVPREMRLEARSSNGRIEATGVTEAHLRTSNGEIRARDLLDRLEAHTSNGAIRIEACSGPIDAKSDNGRVEVHGARSPVKAHTSNGAIDVEVAAAHPAAQVELGTSNGAIDLRLPADVSARLEADTSLGRIDIDPQTNAQFSGRRNHVEAVLGAGEGTVRLRTSNGGIRIRLAAAR